MRWNDIAIVMQNCAFYYKCKLALKPLHCITLLYTPSGSSRLHLISPHNVTCFSEALLTVHARILIYMFAHSISPLNLCPDPALTCSTSFQWGRLKSASMGLGMSVITLSNTELHVH